MVSEEHLIDCGLGGQFASRQVVAKNGPGGYGIGYMYNTYAESGTPDQLLDKYGFRAANVAEAARKAVTRKKK